MKAFSGMLNETRETFFKRFFKKQTKIVSVTGSSSRNLGRFRLCYTYCCSYFYTIAFKRFIWSTTECRARIDLLPPMESALN